MKHKTLRAAVLHALDRARTLGLSLASTSLLVESCIHRYLEDKFLNSGKPEDVEFFDKFISTFFDGRDV